MTDISTPQPPQPPAPGPAQPVQQPVPSAVVVPQPPPPAPAPAGPTAIPGGVVEPPAGFFTAEQLNAARAQEKDKLYPEMQRLQETVQKLEADAAARAKAEEDARLEAEALARRQAEERMTAQQLIEARDAEHRREMEALRQEIERDRAIQEQERRLNDVQSLISQAKLENAEDILPELLGNITGNTPEEVQASVASLRASSAQILANVQAALPPGVGGDPNQPGVGGQPLPAPQPQYQQYPAPQPVPQQYPGVPTVVPPQPVRMGVPVSLPPIGPPEQLHGQQTFTPEQIRDMDMATYAQHRQDFLRQSSQQGPYGT